MSDRTKIEWTRSDDGSPGATWNPVTGCTKLSPASPGCANCYASTFAERWRGTPGHYFEHGFDVQIRPDKLTLPLTWRKPKRIFVNSMSDLFHDSVPDTYIAKVFAVMAEAPRHTFQVLTKRHARMRSLLSWPEWPQMLQCARDNQHSEWDENWDDPQTMPDYTWPLPNVWVGVSTENQQWADIRIPALLDTPAAVRFISAEPLLGPVDLGGYMRCPHPHLCGPGPCSSCATADNAKYPDRKLWCTNPIDWVIVGGESGPGARPMHPDWARSLRDQCTAAGVAFLFKQHGEWVPESMWLHGDNAPAAFLSADGTVRPLVNGKPAAPPMSRGSDITIRRIGKKHAGRQLDGRTWDQYPTATAAVSA